VILSMRGRSFVTGVAAGILLALAVIIGLGAAGVPGAGPVVYNEAVVSSATSVAGTPPSPWSFASSAQGGLSSFGAVAGASGQHAAPLYYALLAIPIAVGLVLGVTFYRFAQRRVSA
jgi:hypothetical protein